MKRSPPSSFSPTRRHLCALAALPLLGCGSPSTPHQAYEQRQRERASARAVSGWRGSETPGRVLEQGIELRIEGQVQPLLLTLPDSGSALPWVFYLPGMGEGAAGGMLWRRAWAAAGYAVLSVQALDEDEQAWRSELARAGDFAELGRTRHSAAALHARLQRLGQLRAAVMAAIARGQGSFARLDAARMALAGYDLGAATALAWTHLEGDQGTQAQALLLFGASLSADMLERPDLQWPLSLPVLAVAGTQEHDPAEWARPEARMEQLFERGHGAGQYLLLLDGASHTQLGGQPPAPAQAQRHASETAARQDGGTGGQRGSRGGRSRQGNAEGNDTRRVQDASGLPVAELHAPGEYQAAVSSCSLALLDQTLGRRAEAGRWLREQASPWLGGLGVLRQR